MKSAARSPVIGLIAIGRNEGERLRACLEAARGQAGRMIYVDSGSTDGSVTTARSLGADVVELDLSIPFTAARARNEGFRRLRALEPECELVQFVDGDCVLQPTWITRAAAFLRADPIAGIACGRRREKSPEASIYNKLCDMEWATPIGQVRSCGGDALVRVEALAAINGYSDDVIAGEEPEMCVRLRAAGWTVHRLDEEMTLHDAAMMRFGQWWKRNSRAGHAYAEGFARHGRPPEMHNAKAVRSNWLWGLALPFDLVMTTLLLALIVPKFAWIGLLPGVIYVVLVWKVARYRRGRGDAGRDACWYAFFTVLGKIPQALGQLQYFRSRLAGRRTALIEYKK